MASLISLQQAAAALSVSVRTIEREISDGLLVVTAIRGARRIDPDDLAEYIAQRKLRGKGDACQLRREVEHGMSVSRSEAIASRDRLEKALRGRTL